MVWRQKHRLKRQAHRMRTENEWDIGGQTPDGEKSGEKEAIRKAMRLLISRDRSERELRERLHREGFSEEAADAALEYVKSFGYVNDGRYAENYVMSAGGKKSRAALRSFLLEKGIEESLIGAALSEVPEDEKDLIRELLQRRAGPPHRMDERELRRMYGYLARRGFSAGDVRHVLREYQEEGYD